VNDPKGDISARPLFPRVLVVHTTDLGYSAMQDAERLSALIGDVYDAAFDPLPAVANVSASIRSDC
jgi:hypothetical protein